MKGRAKDAAEKGMGMLREKPLVVAGVALAAGLVLGRLLSPRH
jgi:ElaB/YqjD/DUF883 family membrane-anchored ribosome-binding protein